MPSVDLPVRLMRHTKRISEQGYPRKERKPQDKDIAAASQTSLTEVKLCLLCRLRFLIVLNSLFLTWRLFQDVSFNKTYHESPVVLVSVNHRYDRQAKDSFLPENNIISTWVEVGLCFVLYSQVIRHFQKGKCYILNHGYTLVCSFSTVLAISMKTVLTNIMKIC